MYRRIAYSISVIGMPFLLVGCGDTPPEMGQVEGIVSVNGKLLSHLVVTFTPETGEEGEQVPINASAETDAQGKYQLKHYFHGKEGLGAPVGMNRVTVEDLRQMHLGQGQPRPPRLVPVEYSSPSVTPLRYRVAPGAQTIDIEIGS